jgi:arsenate reductase-like glutaredoxin family protein
LTGAGQTPILGDVSLNIQIIGTKKDSDTRKAERFFSERGIKYQFVDLKERGLSEGELDNISAKISPNKLVDTESKTYQKRGMQYMDFDIREELLEDPSLIKTPIVRNGKDVTLGLESETWQRWIDEGS